MRRGVRRDGGAQIVLHAITGLASAITGLAASLAATGDSCAFQFHRFGASAVVSAAHLIASDPPILPTGASSRSGAALPPPRQPVPLPVRRGRGAPSVQAAPRARPARDGALPTRVHAPRDPEAPRRGSRCRLSCERSLAAGLRAAPRHVPAPQDEREARLGRGAPRQRERRSRGIHFEVNSEGCGRAGGAVPVVSWPAGKKLNLSVISTGHHTLYS